MQKFKFLYPLLTIIILPLIAIVWLLGKVIIPFRKSSSNGMIYLQKEGNKVLFSPYLEYETGFLDTDILIKVVTKMGNDGINPKTHAPLAKGLTPADKVLFRETTLLIINEGTATAEITPKFLEIKNDTIMAINDGAQLIGAGEYYECEPHMAKDKRTIETLDVKVVVEYQKELYEIEAPLARLTIEALDDKYKNKEKNR